MLFLAGFLFATVLRDLLHRCPVSACRCPRGAAQPITYVPDHGSHAPTDVTPEQLRDHIARIADRQELAERRRMEKRS